MAASTLPRALTGERLLQLSGNNDSVGWEGSDAGQAAVEGEADGASGRGRGWQGTAGG